MANTIGTNYAALFNNYQPASKRLSDLNKQSADLKNALDQNKNYSVELSENGLNALTNLKNDAVDDATDKGVFQADDKKLSAKAQAFLDKLSEKYGDYDFVIADDVDNPQNFSSQSSKSYSVILSTDEIEKMAEDEEFADKVMGHVDKAVGALNEVAQTALDEGVEFSSLAAEVDEEGNMKLFAGLEKMSAEQRERLEKLQEKRAEENSEADETEETENAENAEQTASAGEQNFTFKSANVEATSTSELLEKIFNINWDDIEEETFSFMF